MKNLFKAVLVTTTFILIAEASAQTICMPRQVPTPNGIVTVIVCQ